MKKYSNIQIINRVAEIVPIRLLGIKFGEEFGIKYGIKFGINEKALLLMLNFNPSSTAADVAKKVGISLRGAEKMIKRLKDAGIISREGSRKSGLWIINKNI